ncbi:hypothetical protein [Massilia sp. Se16.2.3]|uniref:hypothetical protein n=1 Tax=Massilia sp. Se16.2.3 TaxID=2709303 RepID=UPI0016002D6E|nr:hypothetical protein [Massilia sp. Se16.2.3]QNA99334.1 hypothetical protein G4G31_11620 [Massilia sp. Se16.2.3]
MHTHILRSLLSLTALACALSACGGTDATGMNAPVQSAAATHVVDISVDPASVGKTPLPDCADQACAGLRIIDGNAEAYRLDAMRRAGS